MAFGKSTLVIQSGEPLSEVQIDEAFAVGSSVQWYRALIQLIDRYREEYAQSAWQSSGKNNPLALASDVGAHEALSGLLKDLEDRRSKNAD